MAYRRSTRRTSRASYRSSKPASRRSSYSRSAPRKRAVSPRRSAGGRSSQTVRLVIEAAPANAVARPFAASAAEPDKPKRGKF